MQPSHETQKVKIIALYDEQKQKQEKYMLSLQIVGEGKYGKVYKAVHIDKPQIVFAVKVIRLSSPKVRKQCLKELQIIKCLPKSLNLVKIHPQHLQSQNNFYIFEEFCDGGTLYDQKKARMGNPFTEQEVFNIFYQVCRGFIELRKAGIFHEDIKPQNILKKNNIYKITDFGISQLDDKQLSSVVRKGTLIYMPPQKLMQSQYYPTSKSQIFSLGVTLYEVFFGHPPYLVKKPMDYKGYLKMISNAKVKSVEQLKGYFDNISLCFDKLIRILLKMIELKDTKRLTLEQLIQYITETEPFKSMKINQINSSSKSVKFSQKKNYQAIAFSKIYVRKSEGQSICTAFHGQNYDNSEASLEVLKLYLEYFRRSTSYLQQGLVYCKTSKLYELQKSCKQQGYQFSSKVSFIQFLIAYYNDYGLSQISKQFNQLVMTSSLPQEQTLKIDEQIQGDMDFTKNEFLKIFTSLDLQNKKMLLMSLKDQDARVGEQISEILNQVFREINCIRINFKEDILTLIFLKNSGRIMKFLTESLKLIQLNDKKLLATNIGSAQYDQTKKIMVNFSEFEAIHRPKLEAIVQNQMKGQQQILYDIESNSDEFQILEFEDYQ